METDCPILNDTPYEYVPLHLPKQDPLLTKLTLKPGAIKDKTPKGTPLPGVEEIVPKPKTGGGVGLTRLSIKE
jgi:hypothetical protein